MGTLRGDNGGDRPQEDDGLPGLPPEWGIVIIPDDPGELDREGAVLRRRFRRAAFRSRWRRRLRLRSKPVLVGGEDSPGLAIPLLIMAVAIIATLTSLFAIAWPDRRITAENRPSTPASPAATSLGKLVLLDSDGHRVSLSTVTPAVILLVDGCACDQLIRDTYAAVRDDTPASTSPETDRITLLITAATRPTLPDLPATDASRVTALPFADPNRSIRAAIPALATDRTGPAVVLLRRDGTVLEAVPDVTTVAQFANALPKL